MPTTTKLAPLEEVLWTLRSHRYYSSRTRRFYSEKHVVDVWLKRGRSADHALATDRKTFDKARRLLRKEGRNILLLR